MSRSRSRVVVVTGASAGVGRATVRAFAREGAHLGLIARAEEGLEAARREVEASGGRALVLPLDVADAEAVREAAARVERELGPIDVWVNCAMTSVFSPAKDLQPDEYRRVMEVNYLGYVHGTLAALEHMRARDRGTVVQVGSALAYRAIPLQSAYCASKGAILRFTESLRSELIHDRSRIHLTMVNLPAINTPQFSWVRSRLPNEAQPVPPIFQPEVAADAVVWAAKHRRRTIAVGGSAVQAILGNKVIPGLLDRYLARKAWSGQMLDVPLSPDHDDNLFTPVHQDRGAHGSFDDRARPRSAQLWLNKHRVLVAAAGLGLAGAYAVARR